MTEYVTTTCRSDYYADTDRRQHHGDRIVRCHLPTEHEGDHDELIDGKPGVVTWPQRSKPAAAGPVPGAVLDRVRDAVADLVQMDNNRGGSGPDGSICGADTVRLQQLLGMFLTTRMPVPQEHPLTEPEHRAMALLVEVWALVNTEVVGNGPARIGDLREIATHIHAVQQAIMSQAAARAYPGRYRLLGDPGWLNAAGQVYP